MLSETVHRFTPHFVVSLFELTVLLFEYFKQTMSDMTQFIFQTFVFPAIAFGYDTISSLVRKAVSLVPICCTWTDSENEKSETCCGTQRESNQIRSVLDKIENKEVKVEFTKYCYNRFEYYKALVAYYVDFVKQILSEPNKIVAYVRDILDAKYEVFIEYKNELIDWVHFGKETLNAVIEYLKNTYVEIVAGRWDYWQVIWNIANATQRSLIKLFKYLGAEHWVSNLLLKLRVLDACRKVKTYAKGPSEMQ